MLNLFIVLIIHISLRGASLVSASASLTHLPQWLVHIGQYVPVRTVGTRPHGHTVSLGHACVVVPVPPPTVSIAYIVEGDHFFKDLLRHPLGREGVYAQVGMSA